MKLTERLRSGLCRVAKEVRAEGGANVVHLVVALGGLGFWVLSSATMLIECIHSQDHAPGDPSWLARLFQYGSPFPGALVMLVTGTVVGVLWVTGRHRPDGEKDARGIYQALPLIMAACFALFAAIPALLYLLDFAGHSHPLMGGSVHGMALVRVAKLNSFLALAAVIYHFWKTWPIPYLCAAGAMWAAWSVVLSDDARSLLSMYPDSLPSIFPALPVAIVETAVVATIVLSAAAFARKHDGSWPFSEYVFASIAWVALLHLTVTAGILMPFHHMCFVIRPMGFQWVVTAAITLAFIALLGTIIVPTLRASRKRKYSEGKTP